MAYHVELTKQAEKALDLLMTSQRAMGIRIARAIDRIAEDPEIGTPLRGSLKGLTKYRVGPFRILYEVMPARLVIVIIDIGHRKEVYR